MSLAVIHAVIYIVIKDVIHAVVYIVIHVVIRAVVYAAICVVIRAIIYTVVHVVPLQNHSSGHLGGWATPWSAEEMLDGEHQGVHISSHARTTHNGLLQKKTGRVSLLNRPSCSSDDRIGQGTELN